MKEAHTTGTAAENMRHYYANENGTPCNVWDYLHEAEADATKAGLPQLAQDYFSLYAAADALSAAARTLADLTGADEAEALTETITQAVEEIKRAAAQGQALCLYRHYF